MRETWTSRFGFIMVTAGFAVGLGNIWRFPYITGMNGGGAFLLLYLLIVLFVGVPLMTAEISLGRRSQLTPIAGMWKLTGSRWSPWNLLSWLGVLAAVMIQAYYVMIVAWIVGYFFMIVSGQFAGTSQEQVATTFSVFTTSPAPMFLYSFLIIAAMVAVVTRGLRDGLERLSQIAMPLLLGLMVLLAGWSLTFPGAGAGLAWFLTPDFSAISAGTVLAALGQAFYSIGIGMAAAFALGSFLDHDASDIPGNAAIVVAVDTLVAVLAGLVMFPALFAFGLAPDSGPNLLFLTMTNLFAQMPAGALFGGVFFFLLILAAMTSLIAMFEVMTATLIDATGLPRKVAISTVALGWAAMTTPVILAQGPWAGDWAFGVDLFTFLDYTSGQILLPAAGLMVALYTAFAWGFDAFREETNRGAGRLRVARAWKPLVAALIPLAVGLVVLMGWGLFG
jgi:NSS family neurotransmitter:Na+ symporter